MAIILTFVSRNAPDAPCAPRGLAKEALGSVHILSYTNLTTLAPQVYLILYYIAPRLSTPHFIPLTCMMS